MYKKKFFTRKGESRVTDRRGGFRRDTSPMFRAKRGGGDRHPRLGWKGVWKCGYPAGGNDTYWVVSRVIGGWGLLKE